MAKRQVVTIGGKVYTRSEVERALEELDKPGVKCLTRVKYNEGRRQPGVVITGEVQRAWAKRMAFDGCPLTVIDDDGTAYSYMNVDQLLSVWSVIEENS